MKTLFLFLTILAAGLIFAYLINETLRAMDEDLSREKWNQATTREETM